MHYSKRIYKRIVGLYITREIFVLYDEAAGL
jgi:hypothetical protein